ncbi:MAG: DUF2845 domain-containing protein [Methylococcaceae bacterium]|nr:DUF2845 domain-containing protein [Methylococcaceae bacterium]
MVIKKLVILLILSIFSGQALALRCGKRFVQVGAGKAKVISRCGEPLYVEQRERRFPPNCVDSRSSDYYQYSNEIYAYPPICNIELIDVWTYNFGPRKFMRELIFRDGVLKKIVILDYGD